MSENKTWQGSTTDTAEKQGLAALNYMLKIRPIFTRDPARKTKHEMEGQCSVTHNSLLVGF